MAGTACAVLLFTVPLAWAMTQVYRQGAVVRLQRDAIWVAADLDSRAALGPASLSGLDELPRGVDVGLYTLDGRKISGEGPQDSQIAALSRDGTPHQGVELGHLAVVAPVSRSGRVVAVVRVWMPWDLVTDRWTRVWLVLVAVGAAVVVLSAVLAWHLARRVAAPLQWLAASLRAMGDGDFAVRSSRSNIREADVAAHALEAAARRLGQVLDRERRFTTVVSHQLRTPLTAMVLGLEAAQVGGRAARREAVAAALRRAEYLAESLEELLRLARETHRSDVAVDAAQVAARVADRHRAAVQDAGRRLVVRCEPGLAPVRASEPAIAQILGSLLDNALTHGKGEIRLDVIDVGDGVAMEVGDDGSGVQDDCASDFGEWPSGTRHGIGLPLARSLAEAEGGRLVVRRAGPRPVFSLLLPVHDPAGDTVEPANALAPGLRGSS